MFLYTDGVIEVIDGEDNVFSEKRLASLLKEAYVDTAEKVVNATISAVKTFEAGADQTDDVTVLALQLT